MPHYTQNLFRLLLPLCFLVLLSVSAKGAWEFMTMYGHSDKRANAQLEKAVYTKAPIVEIAGTKIAMHAIIFDKNPLNRRVFIRNLRSGQTAQFGIGDKVFGGARIRRIYANAITLVAGSQVVALRMERVKVQADVQNH